MSEEDISDRLEDSLFAHTPSEMYLRHMRNIILFIGQCYFDANKLMMEEDHAEALSRVLRVMCAAMDKDDQTLKKENFEYDA